MWSWMAGEIRIPEYCYVNPECPEYGKKEGGSNIFLKERYARRNTRFSNV